MRVFNPSIVRVFKRSAMVVVFGAVLVLPFFAFAADANLSSVGETGGFGSSDLMTIIGRIISAFLGILGVICLVLFIYSGAIWMTAGGDDKKVDKAKKILINAVVGLVITLSAYAISTFILNLLTDAASRSGSGSGSGSVSVERLSNSLGSGAIRDHYPERNATDVSRNTRIFVTFRDPMDPESFISGYDNGGTPDDILDDITATTLNTENVRIYVRDEGDSAALTDVSVVFSEDLTSFSFDPTSNLGSSTEDVTYAVFLSDAIVNTDGDAVIDDGGYLWYFTTGTTIDVTPPQVQSVSPASGTTKDRNITVQMTFDEAVDPTSASGTRESDSGFSNVQIVGTSSTAPVAGTYSISNGYRTVTFASTDACGTNSCNETVYCLPGGESMTTTIASATPTSSTDPTALEYPYDGIVDTSGNALDGNADGAVGVDDDYAWSFTTTDNYNADGPVIETVTPDLTDASRENVDLDQTITLTFDSILDTSTIHSGNIALSNEEVISGDDHELWYTLRTTWLTSSDDVVLVDSQVPAKTMVTVDHGTFLASDSTSDPLLSYMYGMTVDEGVRNEYQNCFVPGEGPNSSGGSCGTSSTEKYCCNGTPSSTACSLF